MSTHPRSRRHADRGRAWISNEAMEVHAGDDVTQELP